MDRVAGSDDEKKGSGSEGMSGRGEDLVIK